MSHLEYFTCYMYHCTYVCTYHCCAPPSPGGQPAGGDSSSPSPVPPLAALGRGEGTTGGVLGDGPERCGCMAQRRETDLCPLRHVLLLKTLRPLDCWRYLREPELRLMRPAGCLLQAAARASDPACVAITSSVVPLLLEQLTHQTQVPPSNHTATVNNPPCIAAL